MNRREIISKMASGTLLAVLFFDLSGCVGARARRLRRVRRRVRRRAARRIVARRALVGGVVHYKLNEAPQMGDTIVLDNGVAAEVLSVDGKTVQVKESGKTKEIKIIVEN